MFYSFVLVFIQGMFNLGSVKMEDSRCHSDVISMATPDGNIMKLVCRSNEVLHILCATFAELENGVYQDKFDSSDFVRSQCNLKPECSITVDSKSMSVEPSVEKPLSLNVAYACREMFQRVKREYQNLDITCNDGTLIKVYSAFYSGIRNSCIPANKTQTVESMCNGKPRCLLRVENMFFGGDPCISIAKQLKVTNGCYRVCTTDFNKNGCSKSCNNCKQRSCYFKSGVCNLGCGDNFYGDGCVEKCNVNCGGTANTCDNENGTCLFGCDAGFLGEKCDEECPSKTYGQNCSRKCSTFCGGSQECDPVNGTCHDACHAGYKGTNCDLKCPLGTYGESCSHKCSIACGGINSECDPNDGTCLYPCDAGYIGKTCDKKCPPKTYGKNCSRKCSKFCGGLHQECHHVDGICLDACQLGRKGSRCDSRIKQAEQYSTAAIYGTAIFFLLVFAICVMPHSMGGNFLRKSTDLDENGETKTPKQEHQDSSSDDSSDDAK